MSVLSQTIKIVVVVAPKEPAIYGRKDGRRTAITKEVA
jgi:hypothetical protein